MSNRFLAAFILVAAARSAWAGGYAQPVVLAGITQMADTALLRFNPAPANTGTLVVTGDHTQTPPQTYPFSYSLAPKSAGATEQTVNLAFGDKQTLKLQCDMLSNDCHSTDYLTEGDTSFSIAWHKLPR
jgi:hypothetical protein